MLNTNPNIYLNGLNNNIGKCLAVVDVYRGC